MKPAAPPAHLFQIKPKISGTAKQTIIEKPCVKIIVRKAKSEPASPVTMFGGGNALSSADLITVGKRRIIMATMTGTTKP
jgi:hypothetical protein